VIKIKFLQGLKVEIFVSPEHVDEVISEVEDLKLEATLYDSHGYGQSKQKIRSGKAGGEVHGRIIKCIKKIKEMEHMNYLNIIV